LIVTLCAAASAAAGPAARAATKDGKAARPRVQISSFALVVNANCPVASLPSAQVSALFLKSTTTWPDGQEALPVDLAASSPVRAGFSLAVHGRLTPDIVQYWEANAANGLAPPPQLAGDAEVLTYVRDHPQAIGYVSGDTALIGDVKILPVAD
jgi:ABC-type phosphate transport system substrate-binding protein